MDGCFKVLYCVLTLLALSTLTICTQYKNQQDDVEEKVTYDGDQVLRVEAVNSKQRKRIKELENQGCKKVVLYIFINNYSNQINIFQ